MPLTAQRFRVFTHFHLPRVTNQGYSAVFKNNLKIDDQHTAKIYWFKGDSFGGLEAVAYIEEAKTINFVVLNARSAKAFQAALPAFTEIVKSYQPQ
jgi:hypothetical protein